MADKKNVTLRVPPDTYEEFEEYRAERGEISKADAGRRLLERGLDYEAGELAVTDGGGPDLLEVYAEAVTRLAWFLLAGGAVAALAGYPTLSLGLVAVAMIFSAASFVEYIHRHTRRREPDDNSAPEGAAS